MASRQRGESCHAGVNARTHANADVSSGTNRARFISDVKVEEGSERYHEILRSQLSLVKDDGQMREDAQAVRKQVRVDGMPPSMAPASRASPPTPPATDGGTA